VTGAPLPEITEVIVRNVAGVRWEIDTTTGVARVDLGDLDVMAIPREAETEIATRTRDCVRVEIVGTVPRAVAYLGRLLPDFWALRPGGWSTWPHPAPRDAA
jgi:hypothetical protein